MTTTRPRWMMRACWLAGSVAAGWVLAGLSGSEGEQLASIEPPAVSAGPEASGSVRRPVLPAREVWQPAKQASAGAFPNLGQPLDLDETPWSEAHLARLAWDAVPWALAVRADCSPLPCRLLVLTDTRDDRGLQQRLDEGVSELDPAFIDYDVGFLRTAEDPVVDGTLAVVSLHDVALSEEQERFARSAASFARFGDGLGMLRAAYAEDGDE